jgi:cytosine/adenosine deaminase-related metal-dependent hydrolase
MRIGLDAAAAASFGAFGITELALGLPALVASLLTLIVVYVIALKLGGQTAATVTGHRSLGFEEGGRIAVGAPADLVTLGLRSPRTAGTGGAAESAVFAAGAADVTQVVAGGRVVATAADRAEIGCELDSVISRLWEEVR